MTGKQAGELLKVLVQLVLSNQIALLSGRDSGSELKLVSTRETIVGWLVGGVVVTNREGELVVVVGGCMCLVHDS